MHDTAALHERLNQARSAGHDALSQFFKEVERMPDDSTVVWFLVEVLERLVETDAVSTPMSIMNELRKRRRTDILPRLKAARPKMPNLLAPAVRDYRSYVDFIINLLEAASTGRCVCEVYAAHGSHDRQEGLTTEPTRIESNDPYVTISVVRCEECGRRWQVAEMGGDNMFSMRYGWAPA
jgi:hypothetical protein